MSFALPPAPSPTQQRQPHDFHRLFFGYWNVEPHEASAAAASAHCAAVENVVPRFVACVPQLTPASMSDPGDIAFFVESVESVESVWSETHFAHLIRAPALHFFVPSVGVDGVSYNGV